jgi:hypothetical protein
MRASTERDIRQNLCSSASSAISSRFIPARSSSSLDCEAEASRRQVDSGLRATNASSTGDTAPAIGRSIMELVRSTASCPSAAPLLLSLDVARTRRTQPHGSQRAIRSIYLRPRQSHS